jgi:hypothetical protein
MTRLDRGGPMIESHRSSRRWHHRRYEHTTVRDNVIARVAFGAGLFEKTDAPWRWERARTKRGCEVLSRAMDIQQRAVELLERQRCGDVACACAISAVRGMGVSHCALCDPMQLSLRVAIFRDGSLHAWCKGGCNPDQLLVALGLVLAQPVGFEIGAVTPRHYRKRSCAVCGDRLLGRRRDAASCSDRCRQRLKRAAARQSV